MVADRLAEPLVGRRKTPALIGVVHLLPLPGAPRTSPGIEGVIARARADLQALRDGWADAAIVENLGDAPFTAGPVDAFTVAAMARILGALRDDAPGFALGVNILRNDASAALAVAVATDAQFIRVNVHIGAMLTDQGVVTGEARQTLLERNRLDRADIAIAADVLVKHAVPLATQDIVEVAEDTYLRGAADALIVTGRATGKPLDPQNLSRIRQSLPHAPLWAGSGVSPETAPQLRDLIDAAIVGTYLHEEGDLLRPVDAVRVQQMRRALTG